MKCLFTALILTLSYSITYAQTKSLDFYLREAEHNSPLLHDLKNQVAMAQLDSLRLRAGFKPQVNLNSAAYFAPEIKGYGYAGAITNVQTFNALLGVNQQLIGKSYKDAQLQVSGFHRDSVLNATRLSLQDIKKTITGQYITAYGSLQQVKFNEEAIKLLKQEEELLKKLTRSNVYKQSEYLAFLVTLKQQELQLLQAKMQYKNEFATLNYLAGIADTTIADIPDPAIQSSLAPDLRNSIFFLQYKTDSLRLANEHKLLDYSYRPKLNVFADGGFNSDFYGQAYKNFGTSAGFSFSMPIYDGGQRRLQSKKLKLEEETRVNYQSFFRRQYAQQVNQLRQQIAENDKLLLQVREQLKYAESLIKVDTQLLQTGDVKISDLILAISSYNAIKNVGSQTVVTRLQLINQLNYWNK